MIPADSLKSFLFTALQCHRSPSITSPPSPVAPSLTVSGVGEVDVAAEHLPVERRKAVGLVRVDQSEKLQLVDVEVTDRLQLRQLGHHLNMTEERRESD